MPTKIIINFTYSYYISVIITNYYYNKFDSNNVFLINYLA
jgi:hypothetical protein